MDFEIKPLVEEDTLEFVKLYYRAFSDSLSPILFSSPPSEACYEIMARQRAKIIFKPGIYAYKAVDTATGQMIGAAYYHIAPNGVSQEVLDNAEPTFTEFGPEQRADLWRAWGKKMRDCYAEIVGTKPCVEVLMMIVEPAMHGKGIGKALLTQGCQLADRFGCMAYVEATDAGIALYLKAGFKQIGTIDFDASPWWHEKRFPVDVIMIREPKKV
ncbi:uncharacterized protein PV09_01826 [Verruconis gallopava]|uniref:N-acetyltransferase domain-containing protein n=1 Tax=Verruconis gallopava TaxID=253628 RepID=A0A0D1Z4M5_9PEZI|nr:uncharacterized protein PV09_01826 [Verruconis gallopava]KIW07917.1 hypothetical protein PV09_01826 [Verruconis gallopava]